MGNAVIETSGSVKSKASLLRSKSKQQIEDVRQDKLAMMHRHNITHLAFEPSNFGFESIEFDRDENHLSAKLDLGVEWSIKADGVIHGYVVADGVFKQRTRMLFRPDGRISYWSSALAS